MRVDHKRTKISSDLKRIRSAQAPMISAGVIAANFSWKAKKRISGMPAAYVVFTAFMSKPFNAASDRLPITPPILGAKTRL